MRVEFYADPNLGRSAQAVDIRDSDGNRRVIVVYKPNETGGYNIEAVRHELRELANLDYKARIEIGEVVTSRPKIDQALSEGRSAHEVTEQINGLLGERGRSGNINALQGLSLGDIVEGPEGIQARLVTSGPAVVTPIKKLGEWEKPESTGPPSEIEYPSLNEKLPPFRIETPQKLNRISPLEDFLGKKFADIQYGIYRASGVLGDRLGAGLRKILPELETLNFRRIYQIDTDTEKDVIQTIKGHLTARFGELSTTELLAKEKQYYESFENVKSYDDWVKKVWINEDEGTSHLFVRGVKPAEADKVMFDFMKETRGFNGEVAAKESSEGNKGFGYKKYQPSFIRAAIEFKIDPEKNGDRLVTNVMQMAAGKTTIIKILKPVLAKYFAENLKTQNIGELLVLENGGANGFVQKNNEGKKEEDQSFVRLEENREGKFELFDEQGNLKDKYKGKVIVMEQGETQKMLLQRMTDGQSNEVFKSWDIDIDEIHELLTAPDLTWATESTFGREELQRMQERERKDSSYTGYTDYLKRNQFLADMAKAFEEVYRAKGRLLLNMATSLAVGDHASYEEMILKKGIKKEVLAKMQEMIDELQKDPTEFAKTGRIKVSEDDFNKLLGKSGWADDYLKALASIKRDIIRKAIKFSKNGERDFYADPVESGDKGQKAENRLFTDPSGRNLYQRAIVAYVGRVGIEDFNDGKPMDLSEDTIAQKVMSKDNLRASGEEVIRTLFKGAVKTGWTATPGDARTLLKSLGEIRQFIRDPRIDDFYGIKDGHIVYGKTHEQVLLDAILSHWALDGEGKSEAQRLKENLHVISSLYLAQLSSAQRDKLIETIKARLKEKFKADFMSQKVDEIEATKKAEETVGKINIVYKTFDQAKGYFETEINGELEKPTLVLTSIKSGVNITTKGTKVLLDNLTADMSLTDIIQLFGRADTYRVTGDPNGDWRNFTSKTDNESVKVGGKDSEANDRTAGRVRWYINATEGESLNLNTVQQEQLRRFVERIKKAEDGEDQAQISKVKEEAFNYMVAAVWGDISFNRARGSIVRTVQRQGGTVEAANRVVEEMTKANVASLAQEMLRLGGEAAVTQRQVDHGYIRVPAPAGYKMIEQIGENQFGYVERGFLTRQYHSSPLGTGSGGELVLTADNTQPKYFDYRSNLVIDAGTMSKPEHEWSQTADATIGQEEVVLEDNERNLVESAPMTEMRMVRVPINSHNHQDAHKTFEHNLTFFQTLGNGKHQKIHASVVMKYEPISNRMIIDTAALQNKKVSIFMTNEQGQIEKVLAENLTLGEEEKTDLDESYYHFKDQDGASRYIVIHGQLVELDKDDAQKQLQSIRVPYEKSVFLGDRRGHEILRGIVKYEIVVTKTKKGKQINLIGKNIELTNTDPIRFKLHGQEVEILKGYSIIRSKDGENEEVLEIRDKSKKTKAMFIEGMAGVMDYRRGILVITRDNLDLVYKDKDGNMVTIQAPTIDTYRKDRHDIWQRESSRIDTEMLKGLGSLNAGTVTKRQVEKAGLKWGDISQKLIDNNWAQPGKSRTEVVLTANLTQENGKMSKIFGSNFSNVLRVFQEARQLNIEQGSFIDRRRGIIYDSKNKEIPKAYVEGRTYEIHGGRIIVPMTDRYVADEFVSLGFLNKQGEGDTATYTRTDNEEPIIFLKSILEIDFNKYRKVVRKMYDDKAQIRRNEALIRQPGNENRAEVIEDQYKILNRLAKRTPGIKPIWTDEAGKPLTKSQAITKIQQQEKVLLEITATDKTQENRLIRMIQTLKGQISEAVDRQLPQLLENPTTDQDKARKALKEFLEKRPMKMVVDLSIERKGTAGLADNEMLRLGASAFLDLMELGPEALEAGVPEHEVAHIIDRVLRLKGIPTVKGTTRILNHDRVVKGLDTGVYVDDYAMGEIYTHYIEALGKFYKAQRAKAEGNWKRYEMFNREAINVFSRGRNIAYDSISALEKAAVKVKGIIGEGVVDGKGRIWQVPIRGLLEVELDKKASQQAGRRVRDVGIVITDPVTRLPTQTIILTVSDDVFGFDKERNTYIDLAKVQGLLEETIKRSRLDAALLDLRVSVHKHHVNNEKVMGIIRTLSEQYAKTGTVDLSEIIDKYSLKIVQGKFENPADQLRLLAEMLAEGPFKMEKGINTESITNTGTNRKIMITPDNRFSIESISGKRSDLSDLKDSFSEYEKTRIEFEGKRRAEREKYEAKKHQWEERVASKPIEEVVQELGPAEIKTAEESAYMDGVNGQATTMYRERGTNVFVINEAHSLADHLAPMVYAEGMKYGEHTIDPEELLSGTEAELLERYDTGVNLDADRYVKFYNAMQKVGKKLTSGQRADQQMWQRAGFIGQQKDPETGNMIWVKLNNFTVSIQRMPKDATEKGKYHQTVIHEVKHGHFAFQGTYFKKVVKFIKEGISEITKTFKEDPLDVVEAIFRQKGYVAKGFQKGQYDFNNEVNSFMSDPELLRREFEYLKDMTVDEIKSKYKHDTGMRDDLLMIKKCFLSEESREFWNQVANTLNSYFDEELKNSSATQSNNGKFPITSQPALSPSTVSTNHLQPIPPVAQQASENLPLPLRSAAIEPSAIGSSVPAYTRGNNFGVEALTVPSAIPDLLRVREEGNPPSQTVVQPLSIGLDESIMEKEKEVRAWINTAAWLNSRNGHNPNGSSSKGFVRSSAEKEMHKGGNVKGAAAVPTIKIYGYNGKIEREFPLPPMNPQPLIYDRLDYSMTARDAASIVEGPQEANAALNPEPNFATEGLQGLSADQSLRLPVNLSQTGETANNAQEAKDRLEEAKEKLAKIKENEQEHAQRVAETQEQIRQEQEERNSARPMVEPGSSVVDSAQIVGDDTPLKNTDSVTLKFIMDQADKKFKKPHDVAVNVISNIALRLIRPMYVPPGPAMLDEQDSQFDQEDSQQSAKEFYENLIPVFKLLSKNEIAFILTKALLVQTRKNPRYALKIVLSVLKDYAKAKNLLLNAETLNDIKALIGTGKGIEIASSPLASRNETGRTVPAALNATIAAVTPMTEIAASPMAPRNDTETTIASPIESAPANDVIAQAVKLPAPASELKPMAQYRSKYLHTIYAALLEKRDVSRHLNDLLEETAATRNWDLFMAFAKGSPLARGDIIRQYVLNHFDKLVSFFEPPIVSPLLVPQLSNSAQISLNLPAISPFNSHVGSSVATSSDIAQTANDKEWVDYKIKEILAGKTNRIDAFYWYVMTRTFRLLEPDNEMRQAMGVDLYTMADLIPILKEDRTELRSLIKGLDIEQILQVYRKIPKNMLKDRHRQKVLGDILKVVFKGNKQQVGSVWWKAFGGKTGLINTNPAMIGIPSIPQRPMLLVPVSLDLVINQGKRVAYEFAKAREELGDISDAYGFPPVAPEKNNRTLGNDSGTEGSPSPAQVALSNIKGTINPAMAAARQTDDTDDQVVTEEKIVNWINDETIPQDIKDKDGNPLQLDLNGFHKDVIDEVISDLKAHGEQIVGYTPSFKQHLNMVLTALSILDPRFSGIRGQEMGGGKTAAGVGGLLSAIKVADSKGLSLSDSKKTYEYWTLRGSLIANIVNDDLARSFLNELGKYVEIEQLKYEPQQVNPQIPTVEGSGKYASVLLPLSFVTNKPAQDGKAYIINKLRFMELESIYNRQRDFEYEGNKDVYEDVQGAIIDEFHGFCSGGPANS